MTLKSEEQDISPEQIALELIDDAIASRKKSLDLSRIGLEKVPPEICQINNLKRLNLARNKIKSLPDELFELIQLEELFIGGYEKSTAQELKREKEYLKSLNEESKKEVEILFKVWKDEKLSNYSVQIEPKGNLIEFLSPKISQLKRLRILDMSSNLLTDLPDEFGDLAKLCQLDLSYNAFKHVPQSISKLKRLEELNLSKNTIPNIPDSLFQLSNLRYLNLNDNQISLLPRNIHIANLKVLRIQENKLESLPETFGDLFNLKILELEKNELTYLPIELMALSNLEILNLRNNKLQIPPEILEKTYEPRAILNYYLSVVGQRKQSINEIKLLIVGQGSVGKTSLVQQILHGTFDQNQTKTEGISINQWTIDNGQQTKSSTVNDQSSIKLNIWDFGGQEIMHATHQFFLTKRSLYLLVLDSRLTQEENRVEYWLKIIQSFGDESPVLIVGNKIEQHPLDIDRTGLGKKYPNIVGILETSAATGAGIEALKAAITEQVNNLPHVRDLLPETWFTVKTKLEALGRESNFITHDKYLELCVENEVSDETSQRTLIGFLHDLGVVLHFQDDPRLEALGILNPQWVTNGVYKILNSHTLFQNKGVLTVSMLDEILDLPEYPRGKRLFIVDMMKKFELCYDIEADKTFLVPDLLPKDEPFTGEWDSALAFQYHYNVLPSSIITRFIVRMNAFVHKTIWRSGVVLKSGGNTALVKADTEDKKIYIWVSGNMPTRRDFLSAIRMEFSAIHKTIAKIEATEKVPHPDYPELILDYDELIEFERQGVNEFPKKVSSQVVKCNVRELLDGIRPSKIRAMKVFISYGHEDKAFVKKLADTLTKDNIESWGDFDSLKGGDSWQKEIQQGIKRCDFFIVVLSPNSVERDWVLKEITYANEYKKKIIPLMLKECERPISIIEKQYIDFEKQTQKSALRELLDILST